MNKDIEINQIPIEYDTPEGRSTYSRLLKHIKKVEDNHVIDVTNWTREELIEFLKSR